MSKDGTLLRIFLASVRWEKLLILSSETLSSHFWHVLLMVVMSCVLFVRKGCAKKIVPRGTDSSARATPWWLIEILFEQT